MKDILMAFQLFILLSNGLKYYMNHVFDGLNKNKNQRYDFLTIIEPYFVSIQLEKTSSVFHADVIWDLHWTELDNYKSVSLFKNQYINMIPGMAKDIIGDKDCIQRLSTFQNTSLRTIFPRFFELNNDSFRKDEIFIVKPLSSWSGDGIKLYKSSQLSRFDASDLRSAVIQEYISNPLLLNGFKFDARFWVLLVNDKRLLYQNAYIRSSSMKYSTEEGLLNQSCIHLTNGVVQSRCKKICERWLKETNLTKRKLYRSMCKRRHEVNFFPDHLNHPLFDSFLESSSSSINSTTLFKMAQNAIKVSLDLIAERMHQFSEAYLTTSTKSFQLLSYDVIFEKPDGRAIILEVNTNGYLGKGVLVASPKEELRLNFIESMFAQIFGDTLKMCLTRSETNDDWIEI